MKMLMQKALPAITLAAACAVCARADGPAPAAATSTTVTTEHTSTGGMAGRFGAGVTLGEPIGLSLKYFITDPLAIDGAFGWSLHDHTDFYLQSDLLWHNFDLIPVSPGRMGVYLGGGGLVRFRNGGLDDQFAVRAPVGVTYLFDNVPVDVFAEIGPALDLTPSVRGEVTGGIGVRFWF